MTSTLNHVGLTDNLDGTYTVTRVAGDANDATTTLYSTLVSTEKGAFSVLCRWLTEGRPFGQRGVDGGVVYRHKATGWSYTFDPETLNASQAWAQGVDA